MTSPSSLKQSWVMANLLVRCSDDLSKNFGALSDYFQNSTRSGGGRLLKDGIKQIGPGEFIVSFADNEHAKRVLDQSQHVLRVNQETYNLDVTQCPISLANKHIVGLTVMSDAEGHSFFFIAPSNQEMAGTNVYGSSVDRPTGAMQSDFPLKTSSYDHLEDACSKDEVSPMDLDYGRPSPSPRNTASSPDSRLFSPTRSGSGRSEMIVDDDFAINKDQVIASFAQVHGSAAGKSLTKTQKQKIKKRQKLEEAAKKEGSGSPDKKRSTDQKMSQGGGGLDVKKVRSGLNEQKYRLELDEQKSRSGLDEEKCELGLDEEKSRSELDEEKCELGLDEQKCSGDSQSPPLSVSGSLMSSITSLSLDQLNRSVYISDILVEDCDIIELCLENRRDGGGDIERLTYDEQQLCAIVTFVEPEVAKTMLDRGAVVVNKKNLSIAPVPTQQAADPPPVDVKQKVETDAKPPPVVQSSSVQIMNWCDKLTVEVLQMYFENAKRSGGGPVKEVSIIEDQKRAVVVFEDPCVVESVLSRSHTLMTLLLQVLPLDLPPFQAASHHSTSGSGAEFSCAIKVTGLPSDISREMIHLFFENRRRTGGGEITDLVFKPEEGLAIVTFATHDVVERVLSQHNSDPLKLNDTRLDVRILEPAPQPPPVLGDINPAQLLVRHLPEEATSRDLKLYFHHGLKSDVDKVTYSLQPGIALLEFLPGKSYDYDAARRLVFMRPFFGVMLSVERVVHSKMVQIYNVTGLSEDLITLYLENPRSLAGEVTSVKIDDEEGFAIVAFKDRSVIQSLMSQSHTVDGRALNIAVFYECLGYIPPNLDSSEPMFRIPSDVSLKFTAEVIAFILSCDSMKRDIESRLEKKFCYIQWPPTGGSSITLMCKLKRDIPKAYQLARTWIKHCSQMATDLVNRVVLEKVDVLQDFWIQLVEGLDAEIKNRQGTLNISIDKANHSILMVGVKADCGQFTEVINRNIAQIEHQMNEQKKVVSEKNDNLRIHQIRLLQAINFFAASSADKDPQSATGMSDVQIHFDQGKPVFTGMPSSVMQKRIEMLEKVNMIISDQFVPESYISELLKKREFASHLESTLKSNSIQIVWDLGEKGITVYGFSPDEIDRGISTLKTEFVERNVELDEPCRLTLSLPEWKELKSTLLNEIPTLILAENFDALTVTCTRNEIDGPLERIGNFLKEYAIRKKFVSVLRGSSTIIITYKSDELRKISDDFKSCSLRIEPAHLGFNVSGTFHGLNHAIDKLNKLVASVVVKSYDLEIPGMTQHFNSTRGKKNIDTIQSRHQAVIEEFTEKDEQEMNAEDSSNSSSFDGKFQVRATVQLGGNFLVRIIQGDIVKFKTDVIVNAANDELKHIGGVARSISEAGGRGIQEECSDYIRKNGKLLPAQFFVSQPGKLPCKAVIHAVGPIWQSGRSNEENTLFKTILNILCEAEDRMFTSMAFPAISTGIYGFPLNKAAQVIVEAIKDFTDNRTTRSLAEVVVVDTNTNVTEQFCDTLGKVFKGADVKINKSTTRRKSDNIKKKKVPTATLR